MKKYITPILVLLLTTLVFGAIYGAVQQSIRMGANDPQIQLAEDTAAKLNNGSSPADLIGTAVDPTKSLSPFMTIYNKDGIAVATSATTTPALPAIPKGVLINSQDKSFYAITWQPTDNLRLASVSVTSHDYYVTSARSLLEVENRENTLLKLMGLGWVMSLIVIAGAYYLRNYLT